MQDVFIGRQPIYNRQLDVVAYELLFRSSDANHAAILDGDGDRATSEVILNTFTEFGLDQIVGEHLAFINLTRGFLVGTYPLPAFKDRVVLEVLEDVVVDDEIVRAVHGLAESGFTIALDDFIYHKDLQPLVDAARYIKMDILAMDRDTVRGHVELLREHDVKLLAEKVESAEDFEFCRALDFDYFQGYFFCRPNVIRGQRTPTNTQATLEWLVQLQRRDTGPAELAAVIEQDVALTYRLLRYVNAAHHGHGETVDSLQRAMSLLGTETTRSLASVVVLSRIEGKPSELLVTALVRARMCGQLAGRVNGHSGKNHVEPYFRVGLFSVLDALLDTPMTELADVLALPKSMRGALLGYVGPLGQILQCVVSYDIGDWDGVRCPLDIASVRETYLTAVKWAQAAHSALLD